ncbi:hypothetical protein D3C75_495780 [compost metagenome]
MSLEQYSFNRSTCTNCIICQHCFVFSSNSCSGTSLPSQVTDSCFKEVNQPVSVFNSVTNCQHRYTHWNFSTLIKSLYFKWEVTKFMQGNQLVNGYNIFTNVVITQQFEASNCNTKVHIEELIPVLNDFKQCTLQTNQYQTTIVILCCSTTINLVGSWSQVAIDNFRAFSIHLTVKKFVTIAVEWGK